MENAGGGKNGDVLAGRDLPPRTGPELHEMRLDSLERRVAALERLALQFQLEANPDSLLLHRLASVDRLLEAGLISWQHAELRKRQLIEQAGYEAIDITTLGGKPDFAYVMRGVS